MADEKSGSAAFIDEFSDTAGRYAAVRPTYPTALFEFLAELTPARRCAWDCGTGNGQAAAGLAKFFDSVEASDASSEQIRYARPCAGVRYRVAPAEDSGLPERSVDLISVAQALHWFDLQRFYLEVSRVARYLRCMATTGFASHRSSIRSWTGGCCGPLNLIGCLICGRCGTAIALFPFRSRKSSSRGSRCT